MTRARDIANLGNNTTNLETLDTLYGDNVLTGRNLIINGAMQVWQRGTSFTTSSSGTFSADRWASNAGASTVFSRSTDVPTGFQYSISVAGSTYTGIRTRIEASDCKQIAGQEVTFSWYAKRTAGTGDMKTYLGYASAEDDFSTVTLIEEVVNTASADVSSDWARYTYTVTLPSNAANGIHFVVFNGTASGAVTTLYTGVQLEVGETATPFEHEGFGTTLAKCQRYYEEWGGDNAYQPIGYFEGTGTVGYGVLQYFVEKRDSPTVTATAATDFHSINGNVPFSAMSFSSPSTTQVLVSISRTTNNWAAGTIFSWRTNNSTTARIYFNAEL